MRSIGQDGRLQLQGRGDFTCDTFAFVKHEVYALKSTEALPVNGVSRLTQDDELLSAFPLAITSRAERSAIIGTVSGSLNFQFLTVRNALRSPVNWCGILALHTNVKACTHTETLDTTTLRLYVGQKGFQSAESATQIQYAFTVQNDSPKLLSICLRAPHGRASTRNYAITLDVTPLDAFRTTISLPCQSPMGTAGGLTLQTYLRTKARMKVGFSVLRRDKDGTPDYISGARGLMERNMVRYYFAIAAYLDCVTPETPSCSNLLAAASRWYELTNRFATQLCEVSREDYLDSKVQEFLQQARLQEVTTNAPSWWCVP
jgi:hypothetical protein